MDPGEGDTSLPKFPRNGIRVLTKAVEAEVNWSEETIQVLQRVANKAARRAVVAAARAAAFHALENRRNRVKPHDVDEVAAAAILLALTPPLDTKRDGKAEIHFALEVGHDHATVLGAGLTEGMALAKAEETIRKQWARTHTEELPQDAGVAIGEYARHHQVTITLQKAPLSLKPPPRGANKDVATVIRASDITTQDAGVPVHEGDAPG